MAETVLVGNVLVSNKRNQQNKLELENQRSFHKGKKVN